MTARLSLVLAIARNGVIGRDGALPWRMSDDLKWFKKITLGKPIIMGRTTFDSLGKPLPQRLNIIVSRGACPEPTDDAVWAADLDQAVDIARRHADENGLDEICVIGGATIYEQFFPQADRLYVTWIDSDVDGDTFVTLPGRDGFAINTLDTIDPSDKNDYPARIEQWDRL